MSPGDVTAPALLSTRGLTVRFGANIAVDGVDLDVPSGAITGLIGPNGAGKTTTFNMICGVLAQTSGRVILGENDISKAPTHERAQRGIGRTFQRLEVFSSMSVEDNIRVGGEIREGWARTKPTGPPLLSPENDLSLVEEVDLLIARLGLEDVRSERVGELPTGKARLVELARALAIRPKVLLLDEPASGLDDVETGAFGELMLELAEAGLGILLVEHDVPLVMRVCSRIYVLNFGRLIATGTPQEIQQDQQVIDAYLGAEVPT